MCTCITIYECFYRPAVDTFHELATYQTSAIWVLTGGLFLRQVSYWVYLS